MPTAVGLETVSRRSAARPRAPAAREVGRRRSQGPERETSIITRGFDLGSPTSHLARRRDHLCHALWSILNDAKALLADDSCDNARRVPGAQNPGRPRATARSPFTQFTRRRLHASSPKTHGPLLTVKSGTSRWRTKNRTAARDLFDPDFWPKPRIGDRQMLEAAGGTKKRTPQTRTHELHIDVPRKRSTSPVPSRSHGILIDAMSPKTWTAGATCVKNERRRATRMRRTGWHRSDRGKGIPKGHPYRWPTIGTWRTSVREYDDVVTSSAPTTPANAACDRGGQATGKDAARSKVVRRRSRRGPNDAPSLSAADLTEVRKKKIHDRVSARLT